jgi:branched-chain amino acid transport system substrate-binding protein
MIHAIRVLRLWMLSSLVCGLGGCAPVAPPPSTSVGTKVPPVAATAQLAGTIKLVSSFPRTGAAKTQTDTIANAIRMALNDVNNRVGDAVITYDDLDDATASKGNWDAASEAANANTALNDPDVMMYLGPLNSGAAAVSIPILCKAGLAMLSPATTYPGLTKKLPVGTQSNEPDVYYEGCQRNFTRIIPTDEIQGTVAARWSKDLGANRVYVLDDGELYGRGIASFYTRVAKTLGLTVEGGPESIDPKATDYRALAQKIRASGTELVYFGGVAENNGGKLWQDLRATVGASVKLMAPDGMYGPGFLNGAGPAAEGTFITFGGLPAANLTGQGASWYAHYKERYAEEPFAFTAYGYEVGRVAVNAIQRAGRKDRAAIREALFATRDYDGVLGRWSFTETGDTTLTAMSGRQVRDGNFDDAHAVTLQAPAP